MQSLRKRILKTDVLITVELEPGNPPVEIPAALYMPGPPEVILKTPMGDFEWHPNQDSRIKSWRYFRESEGMVPVCFDYFDRDELQPDGKTLSEFNLSGIQSYIEHTDRDIHSQRGLSGFIARLLQKFLRGKAA
jgi:hypothetical protein